MRRQSCVFCLLPECEHQFLRAPACSRPRRPVTTLGSQDVSSILAPTSRRLAAEQTLVDLLDRLALMLGNEAGHNLNHGISNNRRQHLPTKR